MTEKHMEKAVAVVAVVAAAVAAAVAYTPTRFCVVTDRIRDVGRGEAFTDARTRARPNAGVVADVIHES